MDNPLKTVDFAVFLVVWNQRQNMKTPDLHIQMAQWLARNWQEGNKRMVLMAFRSAGKSTLVGIFAAWLLYCNPNLRILVLAADGVLAAKMVRNVKRIIERHPLTGGLKPKALDQWASDRFTVRRDLELRDPSMLARGVTSNITGSRADIVICDDVEVPNTSDSAEKREALRERLAEMNYVLAAGGMQLYVGTPHHYYSIYADVPRVDIGENRVFLNGFTRLCVPILNQYGKSVWPEKYSMEAIEQIKIATGPNKFDSQMMLKAVNIMDGRLNPDLLQFYRAELEYAKELDSLYLGQHKMVGVTCWWDPAFGSAKGDCSVVAVVFGDLGGNFYLHHVEYIKVNGASHEAEAMQQCDIVAKIAKKYHLPSVTIETNGIGKFLPKILRNAMAEHKTPSEVVAATSKRAKELRILEAFDAIMAAKRLYVHENIRDTPFLMEMREWQPSRKSSRDDGLDAVAGALSLHPDRLERKFGSGQYSWMQRKGLYTAKGYYDV